MSILGHTVVLPDKQMKYFWKQYCEAQEKVNTMLTEVIGLLAAVISAFVVVPQVVKVLKTKQTRDLSLVMWIAANLTYVLWLTYGFLIWNHAIILANLFVLPMGLIILWHKIKYK